MAFTADSVPDLGATIVGSLASGRTREVLAAIGLCLLLVSAGCWNAVPGYETIEATPTPTERSTPTEFYAYEQPSEGLDLPAVPDNQSTREDIDVARVEELVLMYINQVRTQRIQSDYVKKWYDWTHNKSLDPVKEDPRLSRLALNKSWHMVKNDYMGHTAEGRPEYGFDERVDESNYECNGYEKTGNSMRSVAGSEVIVRAAVMDLESEDIVTVEQKLAQSIVNAWWGSPSHRSALLKKGVDTIGFGAYIKGSDAYGTAIFCS